MAVHGPAFHGPKALVWPRGWFHAQRVHLRPCFNADGAQIVCAADGQGYGQGLVVAAPAFDALPDRSVITERRGG